MIKDITLGQYYPARSVIHRLDPRIKVVATFLFIIELFVVKSFVGFAVCALALCIVVQISKVPISFIFKGLKPVLLILIFTFCLNIFMVDGRILYRIGPLRITDAGVYTALFMAVRLVLLIMGSSILTLTTTPIKLTDAMEKLMAPLAKFGLPAHDIAMMMAIALRFIPTLMEETDKIIKAQQARGADFESGNIVARAKSLIPVLVPLFVSAFRIAQDLAMAMEARCYRGGRGRTSLHRMEFNRTDYIAVVAILLFFILIILERVLL